MQGTGPRCAFAQYASAPHNRRDVNSQHLGFPSLACDIYYALRNVRAWSAGSGILSRVRQGSNMKRGIAILASLVAVVTLGYFTASKWAIRHETLTFYDASRGNRPIEVDVA